MQLQDRSGITMPASFVSLNFGLLHDVAGVTDDHEAALLASLGIHEVAIAADGHVTAGSASAAIRLVAVTVHAVVAAAGGASVGIVRGTVPPIAGGTTFAAALRIDVGPVRAGALVEIAVAAFVASVGIDVRAVRERTVRTALRTTVRGVVRLVAGVDVVRITALLASAVVRPVLLSVRALATVRTGRTRSAATLRTTVRIVVRTFHANVRVRTVVVIFVVSSGHDASDDRADDDDDEDADDDTGNRDSV